MKDSPVATIAYMILFGDGIQNFFLGLSIGAAFTEGISVGFSLVAAAIVQELPHEFGML